MSKFRVGDKIERTKESHSNMRKGDIGTIKWINNDEVEFEEYSNTHSLLIGGFKLVSKGKNIKKKYDDFIRFMVYGTGCDNKSELFFTERAMKSELKEIVHDNDWTGQVIGYKLVPLYEAEKTVKLKVFKTVKLKSIKKKKK